MPEYLDDFSWNPYVEGLKVNWSALIQLVAMPSYQIPITWPEGSDGWNIEQGLQVVDSFFCNYLYNADYLVNACDDTIRAALITG